MRTIGPASVRREASQGLSAFPVRISSRMRGRWSTRFGLSFYSSLLLFCWISATASISDAQTLSVYNQDAAISPGGTTYIDRNPSMPQLKLFVNDSCGTVNYSISMQWTSPKGADTTSGQVSGSFACGQTDTVDWSQLTSFEGGNATIIWSLTYPNGTSTGNQSFSFIIHGMNPTNPQVNSIAATPWFFENMVAWESRAYSMNPIGQYHQFKSNGLPVDCECPHGAGLAQIDPKISDADFWEWAQNLADGESTLNSKQPYAQRYWDNAYSTMLHDTGPNPVNPPTTSPGPYCTFEYPVQGNHSYVDANLIKEYNAGQGTTYAFWHHPQNNVAGYWYFKDTRVAQPYVQSVCSTQRPS